MPRRLEAAINDGLREVPMLPGCRPSLLLGLIPWLALAASCSSPTIQFQPSFLSSSTTVIDFGTQAVGSNTQRTAYLINSGGRAITLQTPKGDSMSGTFSVILEKTSIVPNGDAVVDIVFSPAEAKDYSTTFTFPNDSHNEPSFTITLQGKGVQGDPCAGVTCNMPPGIVCIDSETSRHYNPAGTCNAGKCSYDAIDQTCPNGCDGATGVCVGDPCVGLACNTPPPLSCIDANTSRSYNPAGTCSMGRCSYASIDTTCQFGCNPTTGACAADPCQGVTCEAPPNGCFLPQGVCMNGGCTYTVNDGATCNDGDPCTVSDTCSMGACRGTPKACNTPPADVCGDSMTLVKYAPSGTCDASSGVCSYSAQQVPCSFGCANGTCLNDPCAGGCDDGNPCTTDYCQQGVGCQHTYADGNACITGSGDCPQGICRSGICQVDESQTCVAEYQTDLCGSTDVPGVCASDGSCVVPQPPPDFMCPECGDNVLCIQCTPVPGFQLHICL